MDRVAFVFPGQGSQYVGMGEALAGHSAAARAVFDEVDDALRQPLSQLCFAGDPAELDLTINAQPAILATSIAYLRAAQEAGAFESAGAPRFFAGHSMGQYSALVAAGVVALADAARLVRERGHQMQSAGETGAMAAIIGLDEPRIPDLLAAGAAGGALSLANRNSPGQIVISGARDAVTAAVDAARRLGARRAVILPVTVAAHSPLMAPAAARMRVALEPVEFRDPVAPLLGNRDGRELRTARECRAELVEHLTTGVDWVTTVTAMVGAGVRTFVEIGPGKVLTGLIRRIDPDASAVALDDPEAPGRLHLPHLASGPGLAAPPDAIPTATAAS